MVCFHDSLRWCRQAPALPWVNCEKSMWRKYGQILTISSQFRSPIGGHANPTCPYPGTLAAFSRFDGGACHGCTQRMELAQRVFRLPSHARCGATGAICAAGFRQCRAGRRHRRARIQREWTYRNCSINLGGCKDRPAMKALREAMPRPEEGGMFSRLLPPRPCRQH
jgi:hypothetical protein